MFAAMAGLMDGMPIPIDPEEISGTKAKICPKGCKQYFFNSSGEYSTNHMLKPECIFECFAINEKSAIKKFKKKHNP